MPCATCPEHIPAIVAPPKAHSLAGDVAHFVGRLFHGDLSLDESSEDRMMRRFLSRSGGRFTDSMEREAMQNALFGPWRAR
ncbi:MAG: hypothetical protein KGM42_04415 [Hyphomicrobiales bacterium]|nr:hypothetical protein [Hyphomicrobiales bacterium]